MDERKPGNSGAWIGMLAFAVGFVAMGVWGLTIDQVAWGIGSILFGIVWGYAALRARRKSRPEV